MPGDFDFRNLTPDVRECMLREIDQDIADDVLYPSKRFTEAGNLGYPPLLRSAAIDQNEAWLAERLIGSFNEWEVSAGKSKKVRRDAHTLFAQSEFNRFYCRGICSYVIEHPDNAARIYRARESSKPRPQSEAKIGRMIVADLVLKDLRNRIGTDVEFGMPEINSGLSLEVVLNANAV